MLRSTWTLPLHSTGSSASSLLTMTDVEVIDIMRRFKLEPKDFQELRRQLQHPTVLMDLQTPLPEQAYLEEMVSNTWYSVPMSETITHSTAGTRPGDNLADLVFAFIYSKMLETFRRALASEGCKSFENMHIETDLRSCERLHMLTGTSFPLCWISHGQMILLF